MLPYCCVLAKQTEVWGKYRQELFMLQYMCQLVTTLFLQAKILTVYIEISSKTATSALGCIRNKGLHLVVIYYKNNIQKLQTTVLISKSSHRCYIFYSDWLEAVESFANDNISVCNPNHRFMLNALLLISQRFYSNSSFLVISIRDTPYNRSSIIKWYFIKKNF